MNVLTLFLGALILPADGDHSGGAMPALSPARLAPEIVRVPRRRSLQNGPEVRIWISGDNVFRPGEEARVYFSADQNAYVTIVRIDTDGRMDVLWPESPREDGWIRGGRTERVRGRHGRWLRIDDEPGMGYLFAIASWDRFAYDHIRRYDDWSYRLTDYRVGGDPFIAVQDLAERIVYEGEPYTTDYASYHVGRRYEYPRFACYECHRSGYGHWDPYTRRCSTVYVVVRNDPYHHGSRGYYGGYDEYARQPRYEFKSVTAIERQAPANAIERRQRTTAADYRRPGAPDGDVNRPTRGAGGDRPAGRDRDGDRPGTGGRRGGGVDDAGGGGDSPSRIGAPRRDPAGQEPGGGDSGGRGDERGPRRDPPGQGGGNGGNGNSGNGNGGDGGHGGATGSDDGDDGGADSDGRGPRRDGQSSEGDDGERDDGHGPPDDRGSPRFGSPRRDDDWRRTDEITQGASAAREREREIPASRPREEPRPGRSASPDTRRSASPERRTEPRRSEPRRSEPRRETSRPSRPSGSSSRPSGSGSRRRP